MVKTKNKVILSAAVTLLAAVTLAGCSNNSSSSSSNSAVKFSTAYKNSAATDKNATKNGTLKLAMPSNSPFQGITDPVLAPNATDAEAFAPGGENSLFNVDKNYKIVDGGLANQKLDRKAKTATITIRSNAKWSNGSPVIAKDVEYAYEVLGNKESTSSQYSSDFENIEGMAAYHKGTASTISGIEMPNGEKGKKVVIHFKQMTPSMKFSGNSYIWGSIEPYEYIKDVPIAKLASSEQIRKNPIFVGPYKLDKVVEGESTSWSPNKYYYGKKAQIGHITINVVSLNNIDKALQSKKYDSVVPEVAGSLGGTDYKNLKNLKGYAKVGQPALGYSYFAFNLGHFDTKTGKNVEDSSKKMSNKSLRQAMMYAVNVDQVSKKFGNGIKWRANTLIPPVFSKYYDKSAKGYPLDIKKANKLLDDAGYKKRNGSKWRSDPNGKKLVIHFGAMSSSATTEATYQNYLQQWHKIGLNVKYANGKPMEVNSFYDTLQKPNQNSIDLWLGAWSLSSEPTQTQLYGETAPFNMGHFATKKNTELINKMNDSSAWNDETRTKTFKEWQEYMNDQAGVVGDQFNYAWQPVNKRVKGFDISPANDEFYSNLTLTSSKLK
ncbi:oligopeptide ABC transporter substrate-binding protein [Companilactobacillus kimchii]|uniref:ABC-type oligopeptide transport system, periplasmic component n=2 Tax=Companilactobacillus kimchii TaxID=2801452 RepID=A0ABR5NRY5_9LACO|nr:oligopeptide ABC transporter substrate-binding protein [Companilactobacillus kimchii]KAE9557718.1 peptide ABC transporter substrate-binding protein [Companilactobacillus kimchii]KRK50845.1 ABC-type oligopeptide transport system, periplasmic component [Companilactobacillus kimchii DSM 13961 = JCM 10707]OWF33538.1 Oligopeptide-binding protein OppA [Companilactobacillus kimchii]GEO48297.1 peptide ABC transporter substrate-binding protein [Companilactobacillus paralimentarius]